MKKSKIKIGKTYTDGKGNSRNVLRFKDLGYDTGISVEYKIVEKKLGPYLLWEDRICTLAKFAQWAKAEVK